jgi:hypothetical protein
MNPNEQDLPEHSARKIRKVFAPRKDKGNE